MGITVAILRVREHRKSDKFADVEFLVDSGAVYSLVPGEILDSLEIEPYKEMSFSLADGTSIKRKISSAYFEYEGEGGPAPVVYGEAEFSSWLVMLPETTRRRESSLVTCSWQSATTRNSTSSCPA